MNKHIVNVQATLLGFFAIGFFQAGHVMAQVSTPVVGFVTTTLAANSDTIIAPQVFRPAELTSSVSGVSTTGSQATLTLGGGGTLTANQFQFNASTQPNTYFVLVTGGNLSGTYFLVASNTTSAITVNLDGLTATSADITSIEVRPCWTLATLFPPTDANVSFVPSANAGGGARRTIILFPDLAGAGINRAPSSTYFFNNAAGVQDWVTQTSSTVKAGSTPILPGTYVIHRNTGGTPGNLTFTHSGSVLAQPITTYVGTDSTKPNDTYLSLPRASDYTLAQLGLTDAAFTQSINKGGSGRRDTLLVIPTSGSGINRAPVSTFFKFANDWYSQANTATATNGAVIPAGSAIIIRKTTSDGNDRTWTNNSNVSL